MGNGRSLSFRNARLMAIVNVTPDSFSDGGKHFQHQEAFRFALDCIKDGADILDLGGESTRPGAERISEKEQINRVVPVISMLRDAGVQIPLSVDTTRVGVAEAALNAGADAINDVSAGEEDPEIISLAAERRVGLILMHRVLPPDRDVYSHEYRESLVQGNITETVLKFLQSVVQKAVSAGLPEKYLVADPGLGFGKTVNQNLALMASAGSLTENMPCPVLFGASRKSFLGSVSGIEQPSDRDDISALAAVLMYAQGARFFRVHNVALHRWMLKFAEMMSSARG